MGEITGSEVGRSLSPGFGSIRVLPRRRRRWPSWLPLVLLLLAVILALALYAGR